MATLSTVWVQMTGLPTGRLEKPASYSPKSTCGTHCSACGKCLDTKCFFHLSTETVHCYLLLLPVYIGKKVNQPINCVEPTNGRASQPRTRPPNTNIDVMRSPRNVALIRVYGTHMSCAVTKLTCRRCSHASIMSLLEPSFRRSVMCFIYS